MKGVSLKSKCKLSWQLGNGQRTKGLRFVDPEVYRVLLVGLFRVNGWVVRAIGVVRICDGFPFRNPDP